MNKTWSAPGKADVLGDTTRKDVQQANQTAEQMSKLLRLLRLRNVYFQMEQPSSSFFFDHPDVKKALEDLAPVTRYYIYMGAWDMIWWRLASLCLTHTHSHGTWSYSIKLIPPDVNLVLSFLGFDSHAGSNPRSIAMLKRSADGSPFLPCKWHFTSTSHPFQVLPFWA